MLKKDRTSQKINFIQTLSVPRGRGLFFTLMNLYLASLCISSQCVWIEECLDVYTGHQTEILKEFRCLTVSGYNLVPEEALFMKQRPAWAALCCFSCSVEAKPHSSPESSFALTSDQPSSHIHIIPALSCSCWREILYVMY